MSKFAILLRGARSVASKVVKPLDEFYRTESSSGVILLVAAAIAAGWANSPWAASYQLLTDSAEFWVNDVLMTLFFLVMSLEIRREMQDGALASVRSAALPLVAAAGGIVVPAVVYVLFNSDETLRRGWPIPTATDIAFAVGVLSLLGRRATTGLRTLLIALAIVDDVAAILIIAIVFSSEFESTWLIFAVAGLLAAAVARAADVRALWIYVIAGVWLWFGLHNAGLHPTLAGVIIAFLLPPFESLEMSLHKFTAYLIMPVFALVNAGVSLEAGQWQDVGAMYVATGVFIGFVIGKPLGVIGATLLSVRCGLCTLPRDVNWWGVALVGCLAGIGFTMAIFVAELAFGDGSLLVSAKLGILAASVVAASLGIALGLRMKS